jgi:hypothetical protein
MLLCPARAWFGVWSWCYFGLDLIFGSYLARKDELQRWYHTLHTYFTPPMATYVVVIIVCNAATTSIA